MKTDMSSSEINEMEAVLKSFKEEWDILQNLRASSWRKYFLITFILALLIIMTYPSFWWTGIIVVGYFAGSLFVMLRQNAKTSQQIIEHQKQLKLVKLLRKFHASPYSPNK